MMKVDFKFPALFVTMIPSRKKSFGMDPEHARETSKMSFDKTRLMCGEIEAEKTYARPIGYQRKISKHLFNVGLR